MAAVHILCVVCTSLDPKVKGQTKKVLGLILWICPFISVIVGALVYAVALGAEISVASVVVAATGVLFVAVGNYLPKCRRNYTIGIKAMWALEDEANWNATHRFAGKVWVVGGLMVILVSFLPLKAVIWVYIGLAALMAILPVGYSYGYYRRHGGK